VSQPADDEVGARLAHIEQRLAALEAGGRSTSAEPSRQDPFWALRHLQTLIEDPGAVLFTGAVGLAGGEHYEWQQTLPVEGLLESDWTLQASTLAALAHPARLLLLREVLRGARSAADLQTVDGIESTGQLYHHLRQLVAAGWLRTAGRARYAVPPERVVPLLVVIACAHH
jgi:hypothetical protein